MYCVGSVNVIIIIIIIIIIIQDCCFAGFFVHPNSLK